MAYWNTKFVLNWKKKKQLLKSEIYFMTLKQALLPHANEPKGEFK